MAADGCGQRGRRGSDWFAHEGLVQEEMESTTSASQKHVLNSLAAVGEEHRMPLPYKARVQKAGNNNFPFSSHDNRHDICNAAEYFDLGMGLRKLDPERQRQASHNFFEWAREPGRNSREGFISVYQSTYVTGQAPAGKEEQSHKRYPKHHTQNQCSGQKQCSGQNQCCKKPAPEDDKALQPYKPS